MKSDRKLHVEKNSLRPKSGNGAHRAATPSTSPNGHHLPISYEQIPVGIVEASLKGAYINVNQEFCRITGYERDELLTFNIKDMDHEEDYSLDVKLHQKLVAGEVPFYKLEKRYVTKDGRVIWVELTRSIVRNEKGKPLYTVGALIDISDRKDLEKVLRSSAERLRLATEAARMFVWEWDFQKETYTFADNYVQVLGFPANLLLDSNYQTILKLSPAEDVQAISKAIAKAVENQTDLRSLQYRVINPENGQTVWLEVNARIVYDYAGSPQRMFGVAQNITDRKQSEEYIQYLNSELQTRLEEMNTLMELLPVGIWTGNQDCSVVTGNPAAYQMLGLEPDANVSFTNPESASPKDVKIFVNGEEVSLENAPMQRVARTGESLHNFEHELVFADGTHKTVWGNVVPLFDQEGTVRKVIASYTDFTERKHIEQELAGERELLERVFETIPVMITIYEPSTRLLRLNSHFEKLTGWSTQEAVGISLMEACYPDPDYREQIRRFMDTCAEDEWMDIHMQTRDGRTLETSWSNIRLSNDMQVGIGIDITERKRVEEELRQQAAILEWAHIVIRDVDSHITAWNKGMEQLYGWTKEEALGKVSHELFQTKFPVSQKDTQEKLLAHGEWKGELEHVTRGGRRLAVMSHQVVYRDASGKPVAILENNSDITERRRIEQALAKFARQQEALYRLSDQLHRVNYLEDVFNAALDAISSALQCERASILLFDDQKVMRFVAWRGLSDEYRQATEGHSPWEADERIPSRFTSMRSLRQN